MPKNFPSEARARAVRIVLDRLPEYPSVNAACKVVAPKLGVGTESLRRWVIQAQVDAGVKECPSSNELRRERRTPAQLRQ
ncbi:transposase [Arthrobacter alpinus]|uniref:transposase n=1 Tax=Arthrobacter alpinus TaxID=656366 RepID=UPI000AA4CEB4